MNHIAPEIIPAILAHTKEEALNHWNAALEAEWIQLDCMDGRFVANTSYYSPLQWPNEGPLIELHLMCERPRDVIASWIGHPLFKRAIWHIEASVDHRDLLRWCRANGLEAGVALNPETPLADAFSLFPDLDTLLFLGVHPGWSGQPFIPTVKDKIRAARASEPTLHLGVDGGVNEDLIPELVKLGVTQFYVASTIFKDAHRTPAQALRHLQQSVHDASI